jgi:hypothetical protein
VARKRSEARAIAVSALIHRRVRAGRYWRARSSLPRQRPPPQQARMPSENLQRGKTHSKPSGRCVCACVTCIMRSTMPKLPSRAACTRSCAATPPNALPLWGGGFSPPRGWVLASPLGGAGIWDACTAVQASLCVTHVRACMLPTSHVCIECVINSRDAQEEGSYCRAKPQSYTLP